MSGATWGRSQKWQTYLRGPLVVVEVAVWRVLVPSASYFWAADSYARASGNGMRETTGHAASLTEAKSKALQAASELLTHGETALGGGL